jgi:hypothetical protein
MPHDPVNHPSHYTQGGIECIDALEASLGADGVAMFCRGNAMKYLWRAGAKGDLVEDLRKAAWYIAREIEIQVRMREAAAGQPAEGPHG